MASNDPAKLEQQIVALRSEIDEITAAPIDIDKFADRMIRPALKARLKNFAKHAVDRIPSTLELSEDFLRGIPLEDVLVAAGGEQLEKNLIAAIKPHYPAARSSNRRCTRPMSHKRKLARHRTGRRV